MPREQPREPSSSKRRVFQESATCFTSNEALDNPTLLIQGLLQEENVNLIVVTSAPSPCKSNGESSMCHNGDVCNKVLLRKGHVAFGFA